MRKILVAALIVLAGLQAVASAQQPIQISPGDMPFQMLPPGRTPKSGTGRLRGRVIAADTGGIVRRAQVRISSTDIGSKTALTDAQGRYEFKDLPAGRFNLSVSKSGFVTMQYGQNRPFEPGKPLELADAQQMEKVDISLPRGSSVSGRILDEFGEPVAEAAVSAMRMQYTGGKKRLVPMGRTAQTNDLGQFRLYGLPPGEYYISATLRTIDSMVMDMLGGAAAAGGPTGSNNNSGYAATYYPGTAVPGEAQRIALAVGQELPSVDIQLQPVRLAKISGSAVGSDGKPMSGAMVMLLPTMKDAVALIPGGTSRTNNEGQFTLSGIAPGEYSIQVQSLAALMNAASQAMSMINGGEAGKTTPPAPQEREFATATVNVAGEDITGMMITGVRGAKASGKVVFEGGVLKPEEITALRLMAQPTDPDNMTAATSAFGMSSVKENGAFEIDSLVSGRVFRFMNPPKGWHIKKVALNGQDVTDKGYDFKAGDDVEGFEITMTPRTQTVSGAVVNDKGEPAKEYTVVIFPQDSQKWTIAGSRWMASARPDQQGQFKILTLPPGAYYGVAVEYVAQGEWLDPEWLNRAMRGATKFTLDEGGSHTLDLKLAGW